MRPRTRLLLPLLIAATLLGCDDGPGASEEDILVGQDTAQETSTDTTTSPDADGTDEDTTATTADADAAEDEVDATPAYEDPCDTEGATTCATGGVRTCTRTSPDCLQFSTPASCDDLDNASADRCENGACAYRAIVCTTTQCVASSTPNGVDCDIVNKTNTEPCDDGDIATRDDTCDGNGVCVGTPIECVPGTCVDSSTPNGVDCDIVFSTPDSPCNDNRNDTRNDICDGSGGCAGEPYTCPFPTLCEESITPNGVDCTIVKKPDETPCDDAETCTTPDRCKDGVCVGKSLCGNGSCDAICGEHAGTCAADCLTTVGECTEGENACTDWENCHSDTTGNGLCADIGCGNGRVGDCFCGPDCVDFGDCCQDMQAVCTCDP